MSIISFNCPGCQQPIEAPDEMAGQVAQCPACAQEIVIPQSDSDEDIDLVADEQSDNVCSSCGAAMEADAILCVQCGFHAGLGKKIDTVL